MSGTDERDDRPIAAVVGLPPVLAPLFGAVIVGAAGLWHAWETGASITSWVAGSVLTGALIGVLVMLLDGGGDGTLLPQFLAVTSPLTALLPLFGLPFVVAAWIANRGRPGPYRALARASLVLAGLVTTLVAVAFVLRR
jgi:hypothetical protein